MNKIVGEFRRNIVFFTVRNKRVADRVIFTLNETMSTAGRSQIIKPRFKLAHRKTLKER